MVNRTLGTWLYRSNTLPEPAQNFRHFEPRRFSWLPIGPGNPCCIQKLGSGTVPQQSLPKKLLRTLTESGAMKNDIVLA